MQIPDDPAGYVGQHIFNTLIQSLGSAYAWGDPVIAWLEEWQTLLSGILAVFAACIFAASILKAAHILANKDTPPRSRNAANSAPDLRATTRGEISGDFEQPSDLSHGLEQLRSLVRSALSAATTSEGSTAGSLGVSHLSYERILRMRFNKTALPQNAPQATHELLELMTHQIEMLGVLIRKSASQSDIADALIKLNAIARTLALALARASAQTSNEASSRS